MRDTRKDKNYFESFIDRKYESIENRITKLKEGEIPESRIQYVKKAMAYSYLEIITAKYSLGIASLQEMKEDLSNGIMLLNECMVNNEGKIYSIKKKIHFDQYYVGNHQEILQFLSLAYLLEIPETDFKVLVNIIDKDNISDNLYEFIIKARFPNREQKRAEEYDIEKSVILKVYDKLRNATTQSNKDEASKLLKQFLEKGYYHKNMNLYNSHKSTVAIYCGYWSYEAAAVVKIMGLEDSSFTSSQYYPKDLVHFNNN